MFSDSMLLFKSTKGTEREESAMETETTTPNPETPKANVAPVVPTPTPKKERIDIKLGEATVVEGTPVFRTTRAGSPGKYKSFIADAMKLEPGKSFVRIPVPAGTDEQKALTAVKNAIKLAGHKDHLRVGLLALVPGGIGISRVSTQ